MGNRANKHKHLGLTLKHCFRYGWFQQKFYEPSPYRAFVHFPKKTSEMVKIQNLLDNDEKANRAYHHMKEKNKNYDLLFKSYRKKRIFF